MQPRERVEAAIALEVADRPPIGAWGHDYVAEWSPDQLAASTIATARRHGWDFVKFQPRATCFAEAFGAVYRPSGNRLEAPVLQSLPETLDFRVGPLNDQVDALSQVVAGLPGIPVLQTVFSPLTVAGYLERFASGLDPIAGALIEFARRSVEAGAAGIFYAISGYASRDMVPIDEYSKEILPTDLRVLEALPNDSWFNVVHLCGANVHFDLAERFPVEVVSWSVHDEGNPSLEEGIRRSGKAAMGGIDRNNPSSDQARAAAAANGGRGILVAPGCSIPPDVLESLQIGEEES